MSTPVLPVYFENAAVRLLEHPAGYLVFQYQPGKRKLRDLQAALTHTGNLLRLRNWHRILGDQRQMSPFTDEESRWIGEYWLAAENQRPDGIYAAVLLAQDVFARLAATQLRQEMKAAALTYRIFDDEQQAADWLRQLV